MASRNSARAGTGSQASAEGHCVEAERLAFRIAEWAHVDLCRRDQIRRPNRSAPAPLHHRARRGTWQRSSAICPRHDDRGDLPAA
jgi:hypothetical protein